jgi:hypothetical protein
VEDGLEVFPSLVTLGALDPESEAAVALAVPLMLVIVDTSVPMDAEGVETAPIDVADVA